MTLRSRPGRRLMYIHGPRLAAVAAATVCLLSAGCPSANNPTIAPKPPDPTQSDPLNTVFTIGHRQVRLVGGRHEEPAAPGSSSKIITGIWGAPLAADIDRDGIDDAVLILTQSTGGSGTFYYFAAAIATPTGYLGTPGLLLGDRIKPQTVEVSDFKVYVRFLTHGAENSFADEPDVPRQIEVVYLADRHRLAEVASSFEGEADPDRMTLQMHVWTWVRTVFDDNSTKVPKEPGAFTLAFSADGRVWGSTDCNRFNGTVTVENHEMRFGQHLTTTKMRCTHRQAGDFVRMLKSVSSFSFTSRGQLILELADNGGSMFFR